MFVASCPNTFMASKIHMYMPIFDNALCKPFYTIRKNKSCADLKRKASPKRLIYIRLKSNRAKQPNSSYIANVLILLLVVYLINY